MQRLKQLSAVNGYNILVAIIVLSYCNKQAICKIITNSDQGYKSIGTGKILELGIHQKELISN